jgi:hypothetical protein
MCKRMIEWLCLTSDWYRKRNVNAWQPSINVTLFALRKTFKQLHREFKAKNCGFWPRAVALQTPQNKHEKFKNCNSSNSTFLIDMSLFHFTEMISRDSRKKIIERESDNNEDSKLIFIRSKLKCRRWFIRVFRFLFSSMTFSCCFSGLQTRNLWKRVDLTLKHFNLSLDL